MFRAILYFTFLIICFSAFQNQAFGLNMEGKVYDAKSRSPIEGVIIVNTFTQQNFITDSTGKFNLNVEEGHLIEFKKMGYAIARVKITGGELPFYSIGMKQGNIELMEVEILERNYRKDSVENREIYNWALKYPKLEGFDAINHPFSALSKRNRQIWAFQKRYEYFEQQKFIDFVFNDNLILQINDLDEKQLMHYKKMYRPNYWQIKEWNEYEFYEYIKITTTQFKNKHRN